MENGKLRVESEASSGMKFRYRNENEMKDSRVEWIGKIPNMWRLCKVKNIVKVKDGTHDTPKYVDKSTNARPLVTSKDIKNGKVDFSEAKYISYNDYILINTRSDVKKGDVIMPMIGTVGNPTIVDTDYEFSIKNVALFKTSDNKNLSKFLTYIFQSAVMKEQLNLLTRGGVQNFASLSMLQNLKLVKIPSGCINRIISFLDEKTAQFDSIISKKEALIQRLEEAKKSLISEVVTGKVKVVKTSDRYELVERKKEEMKDSGVEWLEDIPKSWNSTKLKNLCNNITDGAHISPETENGVYPFLSVKDLMEEGLDFDNCLLTSNENYTYLKNNSCNPKNGDVLISKDGTIGKTVVITYDKEFVVASSLVILTPIKTYNSQYIKYALNSNFVQKQIRKYVKGTALPRISITHLKNIILPYTTNRNEQEYIVCYLKNKEMFINSLINKIKQQIEKIKEAKQSLISEAVTGKIEILD